MEPSIHIIGQSRINPGELKKFLTSIGAEKFKSDATSDATQLVEVAGRVCYMSYEKPRPGGNKTYLKHLMEVKHFSVIEHVTWNLAITNVSRALTAELTRHRVGVAISQLSTRYVDCSKSTFYTPKLIKNHENLCKLYESAFRAAATVYKDTISILEKSLCLEKMKDDDKRKMQKIIRQAARYVLPLATETKLIWTINARAARHFILLRASRHAEVEIRKFANQLFLLLQENTPELFADMEVTPLNDIDDTFEITCKNTEV